jgi:hypothetical protein
MSAPEEAMALFINAVSSNSSKYQLYHVVKEAKNNVILKKIPCKAAKHMQKLSCNHY